MESLLITIGACAALIAIVPLMVWGGTGDWRHALTALRQFSKIIIAFVVIGGGTGLLMAISEHGVAAIMPLLR